MSDKNFYEILGIKQTATEAEIKSAYRDLAKKYHPDINPSPDSAKKFKEGHKAYSILSNAYERKLYDESLVSPKIPKDIFTEPKSSYTKTQTTSASPQEAKEEQRKQDAIRKYRKRLILQAIVRVVFNSLAGALGGYIVIGFLMLFQSGELFLQWFSWAQFGGILSGLMLGFIWSIDRYFKIETFIPKPKHRMFFRHFRTATFALAVAYLFAFVWSSFTNFTLENQALITELVFCLIFLLSVTFASDGEMRNRIAQGKVLEILVIFWHNFVVGFLGGILGLLIGTIFYFIQSELTILHIGATLGFVFALLLGSVAPQGLEMITQKITQITKSFIFAIIVLLVFVIGIVIGFILSNSFSF